MGATAFRWQIEPLARWPHPDTAGRRNAGTFRAGWTDTLDILSRELDYLDVVGTVAVQVVADATDVRRDGMLRAGAHTRHPGVQVSFVSRHGPLTYATDTYERLYGYGMQSWQANVRAIALGLEALRAVDRYGITRSGEQYTGWRQLPAGSGDPDGFASADEALRWIQRQAGVGADAPPGSAVRAAIRLLHPDRGGNRATWDRLQTARRLLAAARMGG